MLVLLDGAVFDVWNGIRAEKYHRLVEKGWEHNDNSCWERMFVSIDCGTENKVLGRVDGDGKFQERLGLVCGV